MSTAIPTNGRSLAGPGVSQSSVALLEESWQRMQRAGFRWKHFGVRKEMKGLDVASGPSPSFLHMSAQCGPDLELVAADPDPSHLQAGRAEASRLKLPNITYIQWGDFFNLPFEPAFFDFVHMSSFLVSQTDAVDLLRRFQVLLKPTGFVIVQDGNFNELVIDPPDAEFDELRRIVQERHRELAGRQYNARLLTGLLEQGGFTKVRTWRCEDRAKPSDVFFDRLFALLPDNERSRGEQCRKRVFARAADKETTIRHAWYLFTGRNVDEPKWYSTVMRRVFKLLAGRS